MCFNTYITWHRLSFHVNDNVVVDRFADISLLPFRRKLTKLALKWDPSSSLLPY